MKFLIHDERTIGKMEKHCTEAYPGLCDFLHFGDQQQELMGMFAVGPGGCGEAFAPPPRDLLAALLYPWLGQVEIVLQIALFDRLLVGRNGQALVDKSPISLRTLARPLGETGFVPEVVQETSQGKAFDVGLDAGFLCGGLGRRGRCLTAPPGERKTETQLDLVLIVCEA